MKDERPPTETAHGPVVRERVEPHWLGVPARLVVLCLGCAGLGAAVGLFAASAWGWGLVALLVAFIAFGALREAVRQQGWPLPQQSVRLASDGWAQALTTVKVWRTRLGASITNWRTRSRLGDLAVARGPALQELGAAVRRGDRRAAGKASKRLDELDERERSLEADLELQVAQANERIRLARLPVQETVMVAPDKPNAPYPPPDEGTPPAPPDDPEAD